MNASLRTLKDFFAAEAAYVTAGGPGKADFSGMAAHLHPDVVMYQAESLPYGGEWTGPAGIESFMAAMGEEWTSLEFLEQRFAADGPTVEVCNRGMLRARATGRALKTSVMQWFTLENGLIREMRPFYLDTAAVLDALGHRLHASGRAAQDRRSDI